MKPLTLREGSNSVTFVFMLIQFLKLCKISVCRCGLDSSSSRQDPVVSSCENGPEISGYLSYHNNSIVIIIIRNVT